MAPAEDLLRTVERAAGEEVDDGATRAILSARALVRGAQLGAARNNGNLRDELMADHLQSHVVAPGLSDAERAEGGEDLLAAIRRYAAK